MNNAGERIYNGIVKENPTFVLMLGMCPTLAVTSSAINGLGMGLTTAVVLALSNLIISLLRKIIPSRVRIPAFIVIIASFVTLIGFLLEGFLPELYDSLGIYLSLITVNCIIFGRAEMFASKNGVVSSAFDAIGMGIGFTIALFLMGSIREILGAGQWMGMNIPVIHDNPMLLFIMPAGGFFTLGVIIAVVNKIANRKPPLEIECGSCDNCPMSGKCDKKEVAAE